MTAFVDQILITRYAGNCLGDELDRLARVEEVAAIEGVVFYAGRILEIMMAESVRRAGSEASVNVYGNVVRLEELGLLDDLASRCMHGLRRLANDARHVHRQMVPSDATLARILVEQVIEWHFAVVAVGPRLGSVYREAPTRHAIRDAIDLAARAPDGATLRREWRDDGSAFLASLWAETLLGFGTSDDLVAASERVLTALVMHPTDLRLRQLEGWLARTQAGLEVAASKLEALLLDSEDAETLGLLAGTYKRLPGTRAACRAADLYRRAWKQSDRRSIYNGINAATMLVLNGEPERAKPIALAIEQLFESRRSSDGSLQLTRYWDLATYAEVELLLGKIDVAADAYRVAFARFADKPGFVASSREQLARILAATTTLNLDAFLARGLEP